MRPASVNRLAALARPRAKAGFTLVEILLAAVITVVLVAILLRITTLASTTVNLSTQALTAFSSARSAFDVMTQNLSQATLNTYLDYYAADGSRRTDSNKASFTPTSFGRASDLQFLVRANSQQPYYGQEVYFQAPRAYSTDATIQSASGLLNACGYYVVFGNNDKYEPTAINTLISSGKATEKYRYRLMQGMEPTEDLQVFQATAVAVGGMTTDQSSVWLANIQNPSARGSAYVSPLADNVIALVVWPKMSISDDPDGFRLLPDSHDYSYDSQANVAPTGTAATGYTQNIWADQLPPDVQITMVVMDEASAARMAASMGPASSTEPDTIKAALLGKFATADTYKDDLSDLAIKLAQAHVNFQVFSTTVAMRESKWTQ